MRKLKLDNILVIIVVVGALVIGFMAGTKVQASPFAPGSIDDPLVAKSYMEEQIQLKTGELEAEIARLKAQANQLQLIVDSLTK